MIGLALPSQRVTKFGANILRKRLRPCCELHYTDNYVTNRGSSSFPQCSEPQRSSLQPSGPPALTGGPRPDTSGACAVGGCTGPHRGGRVASTGRRLAVVVPVRTPALRGHRCPGRIHLRCAHQGRTHRGCARPGHLHRAHLHRARIHRARIHRGRLHPARIRPGPTHRGRTHRGRTHQGRTHQGRTHRPGPRTAAADRARAASTSRVAPGHDALHGLRAAARPFRARRLSPLRSPSEPRRRCCTARPDPVLPAVTPSGRTAPDDSDAGQAAR